MYVVCPGYGGHRENILLDGMNVWIYPPRGFKPPPKKTAFDVSSFCKKWGGKKLTSSSYSFGKYDGYMKLVRRVGKGTKWHPVNDELRGTAKYGTPPIDPVTGPSGTAQWDYKKVQYFMFSTGDFSEWFVGIIQSPMRLVDTDMFSCPRACA